MASEGEYATWHKEPSREREMAVAHGPLWEHFITLVPEVQRPDLDVLDFGCSQGGFLRLLYRRAPFRSALGLDIASDSLAEAALLSRDFPIKYHHSADGITLRDCFDLAFSYETIYLLPDIAAHAATIYDVLRPGGAYYIVTGCHTASPLWPAWRTILANTTNAPVHDRSPDNYVDALAQAGFDVAVRRFGYTGFVSATSHRRYYQSVMDAVDYPTRHKLVFRAVKPATTM